MNVMKKLPWWKTLLFLSLALSGGLAISLLLLEFALRIVYGPVSHEVTNAHPVLHHFSGNNPTVNSFGFYDIDYPEQKPPDTKRVMVLGDSLVRRNENGVNFTDVLEESIRHRVSSPRFEIWNCGIDSYSPALEYLLLRHNLIALQPDFVVVSVFMGNDFNDDAVYYAKMDFDEEGRPVRCLPDRESNEGNMIPGQLRIPFKNYLRYHSRLYREMSRVYNTVLHVAGVRRGEWGKAEIDVDRTAPIGTLAINISDRLFDLLTGSLLHIQDLLSERQIPWMVLIIPLDAQVSPPKAVEESRLVYREEAIAKIDENQKKLTAFCVEHRIEAIDLLPLLREIEHQPLYISGSHFNETGHRIVAEILFEAIAGRFTLALDDDGPLDPARCSEPR